MLIETKVKIRKEIDGKVRKYTDIYLTDDETLIDALATVLNLLTTMQNEELITDADIISCKQSSIKEVAERFVGHGEKSYIATLKDVWVDEISGEEKSLRYKVLVYADNLTECNSNVQELSREGYDMQVESLTEMNIIYIPNSDENDNNSGNQV